MTRIVIKEIWKDIVGYEGLYQVSNLGNVRSFKNGSWGCIKDISQELRINHISDCCKGKRKTAGGFKWKYS